MNGRGKLASLIAVTMLSACSAGIAAALDKQEQIQSVANMEAAVAQKVQAFSANSAAVVERNSAKIRSYAQKYAQITPEAYESVLSYASFLAEENLSTEELAYIDGLLADGTPIALVQSVYRFWKTTNEPLSMLGQLCEMQYTVWGNNWIENAFNKLTNDKCGMIETREELESYYDRGMTYDDVYTANILCRKGVFTIHEILEKRITGEGWDTILAQIENGGAVNLTMNPALPAAGNLSGSTYLKAMEYGVEIPTHLQEEAAAESLQTLETQRREAAYEAANAQLAALNLVPASETLQAEAEQREAALLQARENGLDEREIRLLEGRGCNSAQILEISTYLMNNSDMSITEAQRTVQEGSTGNGA